MSFIVIQWLEKINRFFNKLFMVIGGLALLGVMLLATANVLFRMFHKPMSGSYEIVGFLGAAVIAFALGYTQRRKDHIVVDIISKKYPGWLRRSVDILRYPAEMTFFTIVGWHVFKLGMRIREEGEVSETLKIIFYPFIFCVAIGFASLALNLFFDFCLTIFGAAKAPADTVSDTSKQQDVLAEIGGISGEKETA